MLDCEGSLITVEPHYGSDSQSASSSLSELSSWTSNHRLRGLAYIAFKFKWNGDAFGSLPTVNALVEGKKVYNPNLDALFRTNTLLRIYYTVKPIVFGTQNTRICFVLFFHLILLAFG